MKKPQFLGAAVIFLEKIKEFFRNMLNFNILYCMV
jgi:hypothetical protein